MTDQLEENKRNVVAFYDLIQSGQTCRSRREVCW